MSYSLIAHSLTQSPNSNGVTSGALDTTGADLIVLGVVSYAQALEPTVSDSKGNTWTPGTVYSAGGVKRIRFWYCQAPVVGSGHTFSAAGTGDFAAVAVSAWSGSASAPLDQQAGNDTSATPGSITPTQANELVITLIVDGSTGGIDTAVSGGFTIPDASLVKTGNAFGIGQAYLIQTTAAAANPTWSSGGITPGSAIISFKAAAGGGAVRAPMLPLLGVG